MAQFFIDFEDQTEGAVDPTFMEVVGGTDDSILFFTELSSKGYRLNTPAGTLALALPVSIPESVDSEMRGLIMASTSSSNSGIAMRVSADRQDGYFFKLLGSAVDIFRVVDGSYSRVQYHGSPRPVGREIFYNIRVQVTGTNPVLLKVREWLIGDPEPATWSFESTDSNAARIQTAGKMGFASDRTSVPTGFDDFGFGTDGDVAPTGPVVATPTLTLPNATLITATSVTPNVTVTF